MGEFRMPSLGADMTEGKVVEWLVKPGDHVRRGDLIAEVDTAKTVMEVESFEEGTVAELLVELGDTVPVGTPIALITGGTTEEPAPPPVMHVTPPVRRLAHQLGVDLDRVHGTGQGGAITRADVEAAAVREPAAAAVPPTSVPAPSAPPPSALPTAPEHMPAARPAPGTVAASGPGGDAARERVRSSPAARRLAADLGVGLEGIRGTGPDHAVTRDDVWQAAAAGVPRAASPAPPSAPVPPPAREGAPARDGADRSANLRRAVGELMSRSKREIPHYYVSTTIDLGAALDWMRRTNAGRPITARLVPSALLLSAAAKAAKAAPGVNGFFVDGAFQASAAVHLGVAVALRGGGIVAPAIHDADTLSLDDLMAGLRDLVTRAKAGKLHRAEMADPTITVTNLGDLGVESIFGVIYPPQVALVGFGRVVERPVAREGLLGVRPTVTATLSADHRVSDGMDGARYLALLDDLLQKPEEL